MLDREQCSIKRPIQHRVEAMVNLDLIEQIYDVPLGGSSWDEIFARLRTECGAEQSLMFAIDEGAGAVEMLSITHGDAALWQQYLDYYHRICPWSKLFDAGNIPMDTFVPGDRYVSYRHLVKTEYFQDWWLRNGVYFTAGGRFRTQDGRLIQINLPRPKQAGSYQEHDLAVLNRYASNIVRALALEAAVAPDAVEPDFDRVAVAYGLTPAEARLLEVLARTSSLKRSADQLHRSYHTVRSQLKSVLQKTGTNSQVQLIGWLYRDPASVVRHAIGE
jgi:DNA-binding CsgD family transcriptional regulator